jgi:hypothetical protein
VDPSGPSQFARYAYPPNALGYCGPDDHGALLEYASAGAADGGLVELAQRFDGAWPYLELIAEANHFDDPLDPAVVEAYWVGNRLLEAIDRSRFGHSLEDRFRRRAGGTWSHLAETIPAGGLPHHSFHVFAVYPWVGLLRSGVRDEPLRVIDRCRIRWGRVLGVSNDHVVVRYQPLTWNGHRLDLGPEAVETVTARAGGYGLVDPLVPGDVVAMHWDWVCDRIGPRRLANLRRYTTAMLELVNGLAHPAPAAVL